MGEARRRRKAGVKMMLGFSLHGVDGLEVDLSSPDRITLAGVTVESPGIGPAVRDVLSNEVRKVFDQHGPAAFKSTQHAASIHEAGHVVIDTVQGIRVKDVRIEKHQAGGWIGFTDTHDGGFHLQPASATPEELLRLARGLCAGVLAEEMFDPDFRKASSIDEVVMSQLVGAQAALQLGADGEQCWNNKVWRWTFEVLRSHKESVAEIAEYLFAHHRLSGDQLQAFCSGVTRPKDL